MNPVLLKPGIQVKTTARLYFRDSGNNQGKVVATTEIDAIVHMIIEPNENGYAYGYIFGHKPKGANQLWSEAGLEAAIEVRDYDQNWFTPMGAIDQFADFQAGIVEGWFSVEFVKL